MVSPLPRGAALIGGAQWRVLTFRCPHAVTTAGRRAKVAELLLLSGSTRSCQIHGAFAGYLLQPAD